MILVQIWWKTTHFCSMIWEVCFLFLSWKNTFLIQNEWFCMIWLIYDENPLISAPWHGKCLLCCYPCKTLLQEPQHMGRGQKWKIQIPLCEWWRCPWNEWFWMILVQIWWKTTNFCSMTWEVPFLLLSLQNTALGASVRGKRPEMTDPATILCIIKVLMKLVILDDSGSDLMKNH